MAGALLDEHSKLLGEPERVHMQKVNVVQLHAYAVIHNVTEHSTTLSHTEHHTKSIHANHTGIC